MHDADHGTKTRKAGFGPKVVLRILATTDLHSCLIAWDYFTQKPAQGRGLSRIANLVAKARAEATNTLLFDNGDFLNGSGLGDFMAHHHPAPYPHPMIAAMNHLGYDAANLGNHEFSHGLDHLRHAMKDARFALINSNYDFQGLDFIAPHLVLDRQVSDDQGHSHAIKVGVMGLLPSQTMKWEAAHLRGQAVAHPMLDRAAATAQVLRAQGADVVIALAHTGVALASGTQNEESCAQEVAALAGIDGVIAGHSHQLFQAGEADFPIVLPGFFGSHLGVLDLALQYGAQGWRKIAHHADLRPIAARDAQSGQLMPLVADAPEIAQLSRETDAQITAQANRVIGTIPHRLHSYFATIASSSAMALVGAAQAQALQAALQGTPHQDLPILSAVAPFKAGGRGGPENFTDLPAGPFRHHHAADLYMHPNSLSAFRVTGAELMLWLERSVSKYSQMLPNAQDVLMHNPSFPSFNCDMVFGVSYAIDLSQPHMFDTCGNVINPTARRIFDLRFQGQIVQPDQVFAMASNSYRLGGQAGFAGTSATHVIYSSPVLVQDVLRKYMAAGYPVPQADTTHWRFAPLPGRSALFHTSPLAAEVIDDIAHFNPTSLGMDAGGFLRFRLHL
jgi:2',3'-cyclic-nucleotide 2'-phosphodiesterase / 3'-nucleotidase